MHKCLAINIEIGRTAAVTWVQIFCFIVRMQNYKPFNYIFICRNIFRNKIFSIFIVSTSLYCVQFLHNSKSILYKILKFPVPAKDSRFYDISANLYN